MTKKSKWFSSEPAFILGKDGYSNHSSYNDYMRANYTDMLHGVDDVYKTYGPDIGVPIFILDGFDKLLSMKHDRLVFSPFSSCKEFQGKRPDDHNLDVITTTFGDKFYMWTEVYEDKFEWEYSAHWARHDDYYIKNLQDKIYSKNEYSKKKTIFLPKHLKLKFTYIQNLVGPKCVPLLVACTCPMIKNNQGDFLYKKKDKKSRINKFYEAGINVNQLVDSYHWDYEPTYGLTNLVQSMIENICLTDKTLDYFKSILSVFNVATNLQSFRNYDYHNSLNVHLQKVGLYNYFDAAAKQAKKEFDKSIEAEAKEANVTLEEYKKFLEAPKLKRKTLLKEKKEIETVKKELKYLPNLLLTLSSISDEIKETQKYFSQDASKVNFTNIESRLRRLKDMERVLKSIRKHEND